MIDFGLLALFALQVGLVMAVYHVWNGIKGDVKDVLALKKEIEESLKAGVEASAYVRSIDANVEERVKAAEAIPGALLKRVTGLEESLRESDRTLVAHGDRITSLGARISAGLRHGKRQREDADPAPQGEDAESIAMEASPGSLFDQPQPAQVPGISPGFGVLKRRVG